MKICRFLILFALSILTASCSKDQPPVISGTPRKVRYELFTREDFSDNHKNIQFSVFMRKGQKTIFDSLLSSMKISDIPDSNHKIIIEKWVPDNNDSTLVVGFNYEIENVGMSWYLDSFSAKENLKVLSYSFR
jgi:hypothetical protein